MKLLTLTFFLLAILLGLASAIPTPTPQEDPNVPNFLQPPSTDGIGVVENGFNRLGYIVNTLPIPPQNGGREEKREGLLTRWILAFHKRFIAKAPARDKEPCRSGPFDDLQNCSGAGSLSIGLGFAMVAFIGAGLVLV
ncbi:hypothetical protein B0J14DRAFT_556626 [Halenospora varia]|nr:hypothetical protein B0J14DRAFT_556626 [Halenospora varia]